MKSMNFGYRNTFQVIDKGCIEVFGPCGFAFSVQPQSKGFVNYQSGFVSNYALSFMLLTLLAMCVVLVNHLGLSNFLYNGLFIDILFGYIILGSALL